MRKSVKESLERTRKEGVIKLACLKNVMSGFDTGSYLDARAKAALDIPEVRSHSRKSKEDTSGVIRHPGLFVLLKEWRNVKAREMALPHYMILHQKAMVALSNDLPQSIPALKLVKGMGKKKSEKFGEELLDIIISFCKNENIEPPVELPAKNKPPKKIKEETKKISYDLFKEGKTISQIADERSLSINTIEGHLAYYLGTGEIQINRLVSKEITDLICKPF